MPTSAKSMKILLHMKGQSFHRLMSYVLLILKGLCYSDVYVGPMARFHKIGPANQSKNFSSAK